MNTPRTDANYLGWQFNKQYGGFDSLSETPMPWLDFAKMIETELTAVTEQRDDLQNEIIGWRNKWRVAVDLAARAEIERDDMTLRWEVTNDALFDLIEEKRKIEERLCVELGWHPDVKVHTPLPAADSDETVVKP